MRPYRRKHHASWRTRRARGVLGEVTEFLKPFIRCTKSVWMLEPPFPLTAKILITAFTWFLLVLPLCYFLVPPLATLLLFNYFSGIVNLEDFLGRLGGYCARVVSLNKITAPFRLFDKLVIVFFLYDYYQIIRKLRGD